MYRQQESLSRESLHHSVHSRTLELWEKREKTVPDESSGGNKTLRYRGAARRVPAGYYEVDSPDAADYITREFCSQRQAASSACHSGVVHRNRRTDSRGDLVRGSNGSMRADEGLDRTERNDGRRDSQEPLSDGPSFDLPPDRSPDKREIPGILHRRHRGSLFGTIGYPGSSNYPGAAMRQPAGVRYSACDSRIVWRTSTLPIPRRAT